MKLTKTLSAIGLGIVIALGAAPMASTAPQSPQVVKITAERFDFTPSVVHVKAGLPVTFELTTADVKHGFFSRPLKLDALIAPGRPVAVTVTPNKPGTYTVICDNFCGSGHGGMKMKVVVE